MADLCIHPRMLLKRGRPEFSDGVVDLIPVHLFPPEREMGFGEVFDCFIAPHGQRYDAGRISLRMGESRCVYYFGHVGYHVNPPWRGQHFAARACALLAPLFIARGKASVVITADPDNLASRRTCERLGCTLESVVNVPEDIRNRWDISALKCRYIWRINGTAPFFPKIRG